MTWKVGTRVQDKAGFTGTVTAQWDNEVEVSWDVSGCATDLKETEIEPMKPGQDANKIQDAIHRKQFGRAARAVRAK